MDKAKKKPTSDELFFEQAMDGVKPIKSTARVLATTGRPVAGRRAPLAVFIEYDQHVTDLDDDETGIINDHDGTFRKDGVQKRLVQRLKRGHFPVNQQLDLHQMTTHTGSIAVMTFIEESQQLNFKCIRIIHGKGLRSPGGPKLKIMTHTMLQKHPGVLAFAICKPSEGGSGATDVLLKRHD